MQINAQGGVKLKINVDAASATFNVQVDNGPIARLDVETVKSILPALGQAKDAIEEAAKNKRKSRLDDLRKELEDIKQEIAEIEALK